MITKSLGGWVFYIDDSIDHIASLGKNTGKWMHFFTDIDFIADICRRAVETGVVFEAKHTDDDTGVACFYLDFDDMDGHKKVLSFFLDNDLIRKTKSGRLYNISFKLDDQTRSGQYGEEFVAKLSLDEFVDLHTGEWLDNKDI